MTMMIMVEKGKKPLKENTLQLIQCYRDFLDIIDRIPSNGWLNFNPYSYEVWESAPMEEHLGKRLRKKEIVSLKELINYMIDDQTHRVPNRVFVVNGTIRVGEIRAPGYIWLSTSDFWTGYQGHIRMDAFKSNASTSSFSEMIQKNIENTYSDVLYFLRTMADKLKDHVVIEAIDIAKDGGFDDVRNYIALYIGHTTKKARDTRLFNLLIGTLEAIKEEKENGPPKHIDYVKRDSLRSWLEYKGYHNFYFTSMIKNGIARKEGSSVLFVAKNVSSFKGLYDDFREVIFEPFSDVFDSQERIREKLRKKWDDRIIEYLEKHGSSVEKLSPFASFYNED